MGRVAAKYTLAPPPPAAPMPIEPEPHHADATEPPPLGGWPRLYMRGLKAWIAAVEQASFHVEAAPMSAGTPFANVLLVARRVG